MKRIHGRIGIGPAIRRTVSVVAQYRRNYDRSIRLAASAMRIAENPAVPIALVRDPLKCLGNELRDLRPAWHVLNTGISEILSTGAPHVVPLKIRAGPSVDIADHVEVTLVDVDHLDGIFVGQCMWYRPSDARLFAVVHCALVMDVVQLRWPD